jgi:hypothetical protein
MPLAMAIPTAIRTRPPISSPRSPTSVPSRSPSSSLAADGLQHGIATGRDQQCGADPVGGTAQRLGQAVAEQQTQDRHARLEYPKDEAHAQPGASIDTCHPDADRGGEVGQAKGEGNQQESQHALTLLSDAVRMASASANGKT